MIWLKWLGTLATKKLWLPPGFRLLPGLYSRLLVRERFIGEDDGWRKERRGDGRLVMEGEGEGG